ncbi:sensor histidine kinase [Rhizobium nepotum]|uniref:histidine kinase n=1 Tax=Rhizobium nepotum 39/7 TaxID=1368418 RepID=A0ABR5CQQ7_9HYPH|nr:HAMP domain-containing sensor histidine kinase [Rhizobium nepotum]KJF67160.1 histidine kinase [Rhizobium nepotum 39/7]
MVTATQSNPSLRFRLSWQLSAVFLGVVATVIVGLCVYGVMILSPNAGLQTKLTAALDEALRKDEGGRFVISEGPLLRAFKAQNDKLWFVVTADGQTLSYGEVPGRFRDLSPFVYLIKDADIREAAQDVETASIDSITTSVGDFRVMYGGNGNRTATFLTLLMGTYPIYVPLLLIALPAVFLTVPRIVRGALTGLDAVVRRAPEIDPRHAGSRLPVENVPREVLPLIVSFNSILARLEDQFQARQRFLIDAAHELRTPITILQTRIEGMDEGGEQRKLLGDVARLAEAAEQLLAFERNEQAADLWEPLDVVDIARSVVADLAPVAVAAGYDISFESDVEILRRQGEPTALSRAIANLVRNAIDHAGNRGAISISVSADGRIAVADEGPGIPADQQGLVFEPFYRVTPSSKGAGLGLALVRQIAANHGGKVTLDSTSSGTAFEIHL